jgi:hypothetical protein
VLAVAISAITGVAVPAAPAVAAVTSYAMIGDSITWQATADLEMAIPGIRVDGVIGRSFSQIGSAFDAMMAGGIPDVLIVALGTNPTMTLGQVDAFMATAGTIESVFFVNIRIPRDWEAPTNDLINSLPQRYENVSVIDWYGFTSRRPDVLNDTGFHLTDAGKPVYASFVTSEVLGDEGPCTPPSQSEPGSAGVGVVDPVSGVWYLRDPLTGRTTSFYYGDPGDSPFMGDWDGDGVETPGLYRRSDGYVYLRNSNTQGVADTTFLFGNPGDIAVPGDFDGDGFDTVSLYRPSEARFYVINSLGSGGAGLGAADYDFAFGLVGDRPFAGDFDGDGIDTVGTYRTTTGLVSLHSSPTGSFYYGSPGDEMLVAPFEGGTGDALGVYRSRAASFFLRSTSTPGNADHVFRYGLPGFVAVAGVFGELPGVDDPPAPFGCDFR